MLLRTKGKAINIDTHLVGRVTRNIDNLDENTFLLVEDRITVIPKVEHLAILTKELEYDTNGIEKIVYKIPTLDHLSEGDLISVGNDGNINTLYRINSNHNTLLATERCNSNCLICTQHR